MLNRIEKFVKRCLIGPYLKFKAEKQLQADNALIDALIRYRTLAESVQRRQDVVLWADFYISEIVRANRTSGHTEATRLLKAAERYKTYCEQVDNQAGVAVSAAVSEVVSTWPLNFGRDVLR